PEPGAIMKLLYRYLRNYRGLVADAVATINQVLSLLDPLIPAPRHRPVRDPVPGIHDRRVLPRRQPAARRGRRRRVRLARREERPGLFHQRHHAAREEPRPRPAGDRVEWSNSIASEEP